MKKRAEARESEILDVVVELLETQGYEAVQVRTVAERARVSLATVYKLFGTFNDLIVVALERWMDAHAYEAVTMPEPGEPPFETLVRVLRTVFKPWEEHPRMLVAYYKARVQVGGDRLVMKGLSVVQPVAEAALPDADPRYIEDLRLIFRHVVRGVVSRFACGEIEVTEILPILERTLALLMAGGGPAVEPPRGRAVAARKSATPHHDG